MSIRFISSGVEENCVNGTVVGNFITDDPDKNHTHSYALLNHNCKYICEILRPPLTLTTNQTRIEVV